MKQLTLNYCEKSDVGSSFEITPTMALLAFVLSAFLSFANTACSWLESREKPIASSTLSRRTTCCGFGSDNGRCEPQDHTK